jgi:hypothetical protein
MSLQVSSDRLPSTPISISISNAEWLTKSFKRVRSMHRPARALELRCSQMRRPANRLAPMSEAMCTPGPCSNPALFIVANLGVCS